VGQLAGITTPRSEAPSPDPDQAEAAAQSYRDELERDVACRTRALAASEARHRDLAEVASDWIWETDAEHHLVYVSARFAEAAGIAPEDVVGRPFGDLVRLGFDRSGMEELRATIDARDGFRNVIHCIVLAFRGVRFWRLSGRPFVDPATGAFAGYRGVGTDVTATIEREAALNDALQRAEEAEQDALRTRTLLLDAIEAIPEGFVLHDADDRLVMCNSRYAEIYGLTEDLLVPGIRFEDVLRTSAERGAFLSDGQDLETWVAKRLARHLAAGPPHFEQRLTNGRWLKVVERRTSDGGIVGVRVDVTEARAHEAHQREREKLAALGQLAGGVAHEINNLLQPALIFPALVRDRLPEADTESREDLECVLEGVRKVREIVRNILLFARGEEPLLARVDMIEELRGALGFVRDLMPASVTVRETNLDAHRGCLVAANRTQLVQVLTNLLVNAAQAMKGTGTVGVSAGAFEPSNEAAERLSIAPGRRYLTIAVADNGSGMDKATMSRIFEPFFTTKPVGQGTGLGLSVVHGIVRSWHGAIAVDSAPGQGATFTLYLPIVDGAGS
jgi:PAS domain S-box-containing protein